MKIATFTINPAVDKSTTVPFIKPDSKLRCEQPVYEPGGGGVNVSRAIKKLGGASIACYLAGGPSGALIKDLLGNEGVGQHVIESRHWTRENLSITDISNNNQYRFGMPGPEIPEPEWQKCLEEVESIEPMPQFLVASGSLPPGVPDDFYAKMAKAVKNRGIKIIVDTSGGALIKAAEEGVYMLKPNLRELGQLTGRDTVSEDELEMLSREIINKGKAEVLLISLGPRGAILATKDQIQHVVSPTVKTNSTVGAGDSMVAGFVYAHSLGWKNSDALKYAVAAGTAATITPGSELCRKEDVDKLYEWLKKKIQV